MIELVIEDYCQECQDFKVTELDDILYGDMRIDSPTEIRRIITCEHFSKCKNIERSIRKSLEK